MLADSGSIDVKHMTRRKAEDLPEDRSGRLDVPETEEVMDRAIIKLPVMPWQDAERAGFRCKGDAALLPRQIEGFDAELIAGKGQPPRVPVPYCDREHAVQARPDFIAPCFESGQQRF